MQPTTCCSGELQCVPAQLCSQPAALHGALGSKSEADLVTASSRYTSKSCLLLSAAQQGTLQSFPAGQHWPRVDYCGGHQQ